jgi:hypothetical protein
MDECAMRVTECDGEILSIALANDAGEFVVEEDSAGPVDTSERWREEARKWKRMALSCVAFSGRVDAAGDCDLGGGTMNDIGGTFHSPLDPEPDRCLCLACKTDLILTRKGLRSFRFGCEICGNKRCPHHSNHTLGCTASNEPGQPGSFYE